jgi:hypothetical protein
MIGNGKIDIIRDTAADNIVEVISDFVHLKKRGVSYVGLSPFNNERTPSFTVTPSKGIFKDFSSGKGGDCIAFLMAIQNLTFTQAVKYLAIKFGIEVEDGDIVNVNYQPKRVVFEEKKPDFIHPNEMLATLKDPSDNNLFNFMAQNFGFDGTSQVFREYHIGIDINHYVIFWQIDHETYVRSGKFIRYKPDGHRDKDSSTTWFHKKTVEYKPIYPDFNLVQCFFGEHLISKTKKPIAVVESEKTALICSMMMDKYLWLACGSKNGLGDAKVAAIRNRPVTLFPDLGAYDEWKLLAEKYSFNISDILERHASEEERKKGLDLADFLLK